MDQARLGPVRADSGPVRSGPVCLFNTPISLEKGGKKKLKKKRSKEIENKNFLFLVKKSKGREKKKKKRYEICCCNFRGKVG